MVALPFDCLRGSSVSAQLQCLRCSVLVPFSHIQHGLQFMGQVLPFCCHHPVSGLSRQAAAARALGEGLVLAIGCQSVGIVVGIIFGALLLAQSGRENGQIELVLRPASGAGSHPLEAGLE